MAKTVKRPICGAKSRQTGQPCKNVAGKKTDHVGTGKCFLHGGATPIKHGARSKVKRATVIQRTEELRNDPKLLDLHAEVAFLKALREVFLDQWSEGCTGYFVLVLSKLIDQIGKMVDRIWRHEARTSICLATVNRALEQFGLETALAAEETIKDPTTLRNFHDALGRRWSTVRLDPRHINNTTSSDWSDGS